MNHDTSPSAKRSLEAGPAFDDSGISVSPTAPLSLSTAAKRSKTDDAAQQSVDEEVEEQNLDEEIEEQDLDELLKGVENVDEGFGEKGIEEEEESVEDDDSDDDDDDDYEVVEEAQLPNGRRGEEVGLGQKVCVRRWQRGPRAVLSRRRSVQEGGETRTASPTRPRRLPGLC